MEDIVTFDMAKKLKDKGFNLPSYGYYENEKLKWNNNPCNKTDFNSFYKLCISAPTMSQVLKWLRDEIGFHINICVHYDSSEDADGNVVDRWTYWYFTIYSSFDGSILYTEEIEEFKTYEDACIASVDYILNYML